MSRIILYPSKYGATKRYTDWLLEGTEFDCLETKSCSLCAFSIMRVSGFVNPIR